MSIELILAKIAGIFLMYLCVYAPYRLTRRYVVDNIENDKNSLRDRIFEYAAIPVFGLIYAFTFAVGITTSSITSEWMTAAILAGSLSSASAAFLTRQSYHRKKS